MKILDPRRLSPTTLLVPAVLAAGMAAQTPQPPSFQRSALVPSLNVAGVSRHAATLNLGGTQIVLEENAVGAKGDLVSLRRPDKSTPWTSDGLVGPLNTASHEGWPALNAFGDVLYFTSDRAGGVGDLDLWCASRPDDEAPFSGVAVNLSAVNSPFWDSDPWIDFPETQLLFASKRPGGPGGADLYASVSTGTGGSWLAPVEILGVNSPYDECAPTLTRDGLHLYFSSNRPRTGGGAAGDFNIYVASRPDPFSNFGAPRLVPSLSGPNDDIQAVVPFLASHAYVSAGQQGSYRIREAVRDGADILGLDAPVLDGGYAIALARNPGDTGVILAALATGNPVQIPGVQGAFGLDLGTTAVLAQGPLDASGLQPLTFYLPNNPALTGLQLAFQGLVADGSGNAWFTESVSVAVVASRGGCYSSAKACIGGCFSSIPSNIVSCLIQKVWKIVFGVKSYAKAVAKCIGKNFGNCLYSCVKTYVRCIF